MSKARWKPPEFADRIDTSVDTCGPQLDQLRPDHHLTLCSSQHRAEKRSRTPDQSHTFSMSATSSPPHSRRASVPRPPPSPSPLRPSSPPTPNAAAANISRSASGGPDGKRLSVPSSPPQKPRARDLLRKHYGLGVGPPPPSPGVPADPMNLG